MNLYQHDPDCEDWEFPGPCQCNEPSGRDNPTSISNLMIEGPPETACPRCQSVNVRVENHWEQPGIVCGDCGYGT